MWLRFRLECTCELICTYVFSIEPKNAVTLNIQYFIYLAVSRNHTTAPAATTIKNHNYFYHFPLRSYVAGVCWSEGSWQELSLLFCWINQFYLGDLRPQPRPVIVCFVHHEHKHHITWWHGGLVLQHRIIGEACAALLAVFNPSCARLGHIVVAVAQHELEV